MEPPAFDGNYITLVISPIVSDEDGTGSSSSSIRGQNDSLLVIGSFATIPCQASSGAV